MLIICLSLLISLLLPIASTASPVSVIPSIKVNCVVLTKNKQAKNIATLAQCKKEVKILNQFFVTQKGKKLINFTFQSFANYSQIKDSPCEFIKYGDTKNYHQNEVKKLYWACKDKRVRSPHAINFFIVDSYSKKEGYGNRDSHGKNSGNHPFILIDWERLGHKEQSPEEHEMGHAFGLPHICEKGASFHSDTNIMASAGNCVGSGGNRKIGFNQKQVSIIKKHLKLVKKRLAIE